MQEHVFLPSYKKKMENIILTHFINFTKSYKNIYKKKKKHSKVQHHFSERNSKF